MLKELPRHPMNGIPLLFVFPVVLILSIIGIVYFGGLRELLWPALACAAVALVTFVMFFGFFMVDPNEARVMQLFGKYVGTARDAGLRWANPFYTKRKVSVRVRNFETGKLKVNDIRGNPIEIGAIVVWAVVDTAEAIFRVDNYEHFVQVQSESALRNLATGYAYDSYADEERCLVGHTAEISEKLKAEIQERLAEAGVEVIEARISHLAYASEIAAAMLQRQQASAVVAARQKIVEGAVGMVEMALDMLKAKNVVELDAERRSAMVSNLLVVLCSDRSAQPVVNTGTLYH
jgi:regulator of protease activity HflC (stomatin/prohibitin superfamily)